MSLMDTVIDTPTLAPPKLVVYGQAGVGKSTFGASAGALLVDCENGAGAIPNLRRTPYLETWLEMRKWLIELSEQKSPPEVMAVDTIDWMIQRIVEYVTIDLDPKANGSVTSTLGSSHGGYFKAREIVQNIVYREVLPLLNRFTHKGTAVILLAHARNVQITTPEGYNLRMASPDLPDWIAPPFIEWADCLFYLQAAPGGKRSILTTGTNVILAKNRYSLPPEMESSWQTFLNLMWTPKNEPAGAGG